MASVSKELNYYFISLSLNLTFFIKTFSLEYNCFMMFCSKLGKEYIKAVYYHPAYLISVQSTSCKTPGWMKHKLESRLPGEIPITSGMQIPPLWQKVKKN